ncbi:MAG: hypothetical protein LE168_02715, partial [Endomicrobium sp.]|nr:hypothetical protein [Endomicrobium sp.]
KELSAKGLDVLIDDRNERAGIKFKDADLIGILYGIPIKSASLNLMPALSFLSSIKTSRPFAESSLYILSVTSSVFSSA